MPYFHNIIARWIVLLFAILLSGCQALSLSGPFGSEPIGQWGTWTGIVTPIEVSNISGEKFIVATLIIDSGPQYNPTSHRDHPSNASGEPENELKYVGNGKQPLLAQDSSQSHTILASDFPVGKRITAQGWMMITWANVPLRSKSLHGGNVARSDQGRKFDYMQGSEHVIVLRRYRVDGQGKWINVPLDP